MGHVFDLKKVTAQILQSVVFLVWEDAKNRDEKRRVVREGTHFVRRPQCKRCASPGAIAHRHGWLGVHSRTCFQDGEQAPRIALLAFKRFVVRQYFNHGTPLDGPSGEPAPSLDSTPLSTGYWIWRSCRVLCVTCSTENKHPQWLARFVKSCAGTRSR